MVPSCPPTVAGLPSKPPSKPPGKPRWQWSAAKTAGLATALVGLAVGVAACAPEGTTQPIDTRFHAPWIVESLVTEGDALDLTNAVIVVEIDTGRLSVSALTGCRTLLGSYSFLDDGRAGFTLPGGSRNRCHPTGDAAPHALDEAFVAALTQIEQWEATESQLRLLGVDGEIILRRP